MTTAGLGLSGQTQPSVGANVLEKSNTRDRFVCCGQSDGCDPFNVDVESGSGTRSDGSRSCAADRASAAANGADQGAASVTSAAKKLARRRRRWRDMPSWSAGHITGTSQPDLNVDGGTSVGRVWTRGGRAGRPPAYLKAFDLSETVGLHLLQRPVHTGRLRTPTRPWSTMGAHFGPNG
ncbi:MAG: hypothetical protein WKF73_20965 [Nocardioidaceae bacterium]